MRIDSLNGNSYYYQLLASQKSSQNSSTEVESLSSLLGSTSLTSELATSESESSELDIETLMSQMSSDQQAQFMKMKMHVPSEEMEAKRVEMDQLMETVARTDLESLSMDEKQSLLSEVVTQMSEMHNQTVNTEQISSLSEEEVTSILNDVKTQFAQRSTQGKGNGMRPSGPPPSGPPPSGLPPSGAPKSGSATNGVSESESTDEEDEITTLEALLEALAAEEEEEEAEKSLTSETDYAQAFQTAIEQYMKNQNWELEGNLLNTLTQK